MSASDEAKRLERMRREAEKSDRLTMIGARAGIRARGDIERALADPESSFASGFRSELLRAAQHGETAMPDILAVLGAQYGELLNAAERRVAQVWDERYAQGYRAGYDRGLEDGRKASEREAA